MCVYICIYLIITWGGVPSSPFPTQILRRLRCIGQVTVERRRITSVIFEHGLNKRSFHGVQEINVPLVCPMPIRSLNFLGVFGHQPPRGQCRSRRRVVFAGGIVDGGWGLICCINIIRVLPCFIVWPKVGSTISASLDYYSSVRVSFLSYSLFHVDTSHHLFPFSRFLWFVIYSLPFGFFFFFL